MYQKLIQKCDAISQFNMDTSIGIGRLGEFADCPVIIDDDDDIRDIAALAVY